jgi:hypothetical protein
MRLLQTLLVLSLHNARSETCVPHEVVCTKELRPVCAARVTYANPCLARAACHGEDFVLGLCADGQPKAEQVATDQQNLLAGGAPVGGGQAANEAFGRHYTATSGTPDEKEGEVKGEQPTAGLAESLLVGGVPIGDGPAFNEAFGGHYTATSADEKEGEVEGEQRTAGLPESLLVGGVPIGDGLASNEAFGGHYTATSSSPEEKAGEVGSAEPDAECSGGRVWRECGSRCTRTCDSPAIMPCVLMCVPRCECPGEKPIWHEGACIEAEECPPQEKMSEPLRGLQDKDAPPKDAPPAAAPLLAGGVLPLGGAEVAPGSKAARLAAFGLEQLQSKVCSASNSLGCAQLQGASVERVLSASTQVVAGLNSRVVVQTTAGQLTMAFFEQPWTQTLELTEASLSAAVGGVSEALVISDLIKEPLALDADGLASSSASTDGAEEEDAEEGDAEAGGAEKGEAQKGEAEKGDALGGAQAVRTAPDEKVASLPRGLTSYQDAGSAPPGATHDPSEQGIAGFVASEHSLGAPAGMPSTKNRMLDVCLVTVAITGLAFLALRVAPKRSRADSSHKEQARPAMSRVAAQLGAGRLSGFGANTRPMDLV